MKRYECLKLLASMLDPKVIVVTNIGPISREWNALGRAMPISCR